MYMTYMYVFSSQCNNSGRTVHTVDDADETPEQKDDQKNRGFVTSAERTVQKDNVKDERPRDDDCINYLATKEESSTAPHKTLVRHYYTIRSTLRAFMLSP